jgi:hypothetical protein
LRASSVKFPLLIAASAMARIALGLVPFPIKVITVRARSADIGTPRRASVFCDFKKAVLMSVFLAPLELFNYVNRMNKSTTKNRGRPKLSEERVLVSVRLSQQEAAKLDRLAKEEGSRSIVIKRLLGDAVDV